MNSVNAVVTPSQEPAGVALHPIIPALCVPILSTPPFLSVLPLSSSSSLQRCQRENSYSMALSLPQPHNVGYVMAVTPLLLAHSQDIRASSPAKAVRGHTVENVPVCNKTQCVFVCVKMTVSHVSSPAGGCLHSTTDSRRPHPGATGRRRLLVKHSTLPHHSDQRFLFSLPCPPPGSSPAFLFRLSHPCLASTRQCYPPAFPTTPSTAALHTWAGPLAPAPHAPDWWTPSGFPGEPPSIIRATGPSPEHRCCWAHSVTMALSLTSTSEEIK